jgi:SAM-dependent methyltransferase
MGTVRIALRYAIGHTRAAWEDRAFDRRHGIDTRGTTGRSRRETLRREVGGESARWITGFGPMRKELFEEVLDRLPIRATDFAFVDVGSGKGRMLLLAACRPFRRVIGVEIAKSLHDAASRNLASSRLPRRAASVELRRMDARDFGFPDDPLVVYLFHPFGEEVMRVVLANLEGEWRRQPRPIYLLYLNPVHAALCDRAAFLERFASAPNYAIYRSTPVIADDGERPRA